MSQNHRHDYIDNGRHEDGSHFMDIADDKGSNEEDTPDSLEIKPPQVVNRYPKKKKYKSSSLREKKHSREHKHKDRSRDRDRDIRDSRHHDSRISGDLSLRTIDQRHHSSKSNSNIDSMDRYVKLQPRDREYYTKTVCKEREREKVRIKEYDRKRDSPDKTEVDRALEDLRSRLLSKRSRQDIERSKAEEHQNFQEYSRTSEKEVTRYEYESRRTENVTKVFHRKHHSKKSVVEVIDSPENYADMDNASNDRNKMEKQYTEDPELVARRSKLLEAVGRKEMAREKLEARRVMQREKEDVMETSPPPPRKHHKRHHNASRKRKHEARKDIVHISDNSDNGDNDERYEKEEQNEDDEGDDTVSGSGSSTSSDYSEDEEHSEGELPASPLSVGDLSKSEHRKRHNRTKSRSTSKSRSRSVSKSRSRSRSRSLSHSRSESRSRSRTPSRFGSRSKSRSPSRTPSPSPKQRNRSRPTSPTSELAKDKNQDAGTEDKPNEISEIKAPPEEDLPNYYPGLHGCRSVEEFRCLNRIAEGTYGIVYRAQDKRTQEIVALKRLKMEKEKDGFPITSLREINTLLKGQHPNIVTVREIVVGSNMDKIFIVMDYVEHDFKTLMETMQHRKQSFLPGEVKCLTQQLLRAVAHLHDNWILHRDLKTSNLLLSHKGILKVGDFGLAREYGSPLKPYTSIVVTLWYRAPELLLCCKEYSTPIDMWSVGCIFAEFLSMAPLLPGQSETDQLNKIFKFLGTPNENIWPGYSQLPAVQKIKFAEYPVSNLREKFSRRTSESGLGLLQGLLTYDPKQRFTAEQALRSNYFKELPLPIDPAMLPTWPAKSELGARKVLASSPKPPSGGGQFKKLGISDAEETRGFILGAGMDSRQLAMGPGFSLKF